MKTIFKKFYNTDEVERWANDYKSHFPQTDKDIYHALDLYSGSAFLPINNYFRHGNTDLLSCEDFADSINCIAKDLPNYHIPENILVYRYVSAKFLKTLCPNVRLKRGSIICDPGVMSASLLRNAYQRKHKQNICLIISVPKGTKGTYIGTIQGTLPEHEIVLATNTTLRIDAVSLFHQSLCCTVIE